MTSSPTPVRFGSWLRALKPASWPKLVWPTLLGQVFGAHVNGSFSGRALVAGLWFTAAGTAFIVLANDVADVHVDRVKREMFRDSTSIKTIPDGIIARGPMAVAALASGALALGAALWIEVELSRDASVLAALLCMLTFVAYSLPPIRLNYRGGGELLEAFGAGAALPAYNVYMQAGHVPVPVAITLVGFVFLCFASALASGLADEQSDRVGGKRTVASVFGNARARVWVSGALVCASVSWVLTATYLFTRNDTVLGTAIVLASAVAAVSVPVVRRQGEFAGTNEFDAQRSFKRTLHRSIAVASLSCTFVVWAMDLRASFS